MQARQHWGEQLQLCISLKSLQVQNAAAALAESKYALKAAAGIAGALNAYMCMLAMYAKQHGEEVIHAPANYMAAVSSRESAACGR